jgi:FKBP-type peptidyl-prolyl cis-trans isomerase FklB
MRIRHRAIGLVLGAFALGACDKIDTGAGSKELKTEKDKVSYGIGLDIGRTLKAQSLGSEDLDLGKLRQGMQDALSGNKAMLSDSSLQQVMMGFQQKMMAKQDSLNKKKGEENLKAGEAFLAKNGKEAGVVTLPDGLQYKILKEGTGKKPDSSSTVTVNYVGTLLDGTEFDSSIKRGQPATFPVTGVIPGWTEALQLMPVGSKWKLWIPSKLAYGEQRRGKDITPNSTLVFEVELLSIQEPEKSSGASKMPAAPAGKAGAKAPAAPKAK